MCASAAFWCEIPRDPYMVKAERECEAEGSGICYHSVEVKQPQEKFTGKLKIS